MNEYIAFQTVDREGDIWCNKAILFTTKEKVLEFFNNPLEVLKTLGHELDSENGETIEDINYQKHFVNNTDNLNAVTYKCDYAGEVRIANMSKGYLIS